MSRLDDILETYCTANTEKWAKREIKELFLELIDTKSQASKTSNTYKDGYLDGRATLQVQLRKIVEEL